jgi:hypothetical protein
MLETYARQAVPSRDLVFILLLQLVTPAGFISSGLLVAIDGALGINTTPPSAGV